MLVDVHSHILPFVDDGSDSLENSVELIKNCAQNGVSKIILTPHYKRGVYQIEKGKLVSNFNDFCDEIKSRGIDVELYLGQEIFCDENIYKLIKNKEVLTINNTQYILLEFDYYNNTDLLDYAYNVSQMGYVPVIAHIERYKYLDADTLIDLHQMGALIQINASSVIGEYGKKFQKRVFAAIKSGLVNFVATDIHDDRKVSLKEAYDVVCKKFSKRVADDLFINNSQIFFD